MPRHTPTDSRPRATAAAGFTLIEVILTMAISAIVLAGIGSVFFSAIRLRDRTAALLDASAPVYQAVSFLRRDLESALPPGGVLAGDFRCGAASSSGLGQSYALQFCCASGLLANDTPSSDIQEVVYELRDAPLLAGRPHKQLVRSVARNVLTTGILETDDQTLLPNVESLEVACYDGYQWRDTWDTSLSDTNLPSAVRIRLLMGSDDTRGYNDQKAVELIFPLVCQSRTNAPATTGGGQ